MVNSIGRHNNIFALLNQKMGIFSAQANVSVANIANVDTPKYKAKEIVPLSADTHSLDLAKTNIRHFDGKFGDLGYRIKENDQPNIEGNTASLKENAMQFQQAKIQEAQTFGLFRILNDINHLPVRIIQSAIKA